MTHINEKILTERLLKLKIANRDPSDKRTIEELRAEAAKEASAYRNKEPKKVQYVQPTAKFTKKSSTKKDGDINAD